jgi:integral membrane sensor domain MASE1
MEPMQELEVTWQRVLSVWWLIVWRAALGGAILGAMIGAVLGFIEGMIGVSTQTITLSSGAAGALANLIWSLFVVRMALRKKYGEFRLALVPRAP